MNPLLVTLIAGWMHAWAPVSIAGPAISWAQTTVTLPAPVYTAPGQDDSAWVMGMAQDGSWSQVGVDQLPTGPQLFYEDSGSLPVWLGPSSNTATVAVSCDLGTDLWHDWADGRIVHSVALGGVCGGGTWTRAQETIWAPGQSQPGAPGALWAGTVADEDGSEVGW